MSEGWPKCVDATVYAKDTAPVGPEGHCTWCRKPHGDNHTADCPVCVHRLYDAAPRKWLPIETYLSGQYAMFWLPEGERGVGGIETAMIFRDDDGTLDFRNVWSHGGPNSGYDWSLDEMPTHWMPLPGGPDA